MDAREVIAQLQADPPLRELLRAVLLSEELLALPGIVRLQGENLARLTDRVDELARVQVEHTQTLGRLAEVVVQLTDRVGVQLGMIAEQGRTLVRHGAMLEAITATLARLEQRLA